METKVSEILESILSLLGLEGSFDVEEKEEAVFVHIETPEAGMLIGRGGETLQALQLIVNQIAYKQALKEGLESKRIVVDVSNWRKDKEEDLTQKAEGWAAKVTETKEPMELEPMPSWQRRVIHLAIEKTPGVKSESVGEGQDRHLVISPE